MTRSRRMALWALLVVLIAGAVVLLTRDTDGGYTVRAEIADASGVAKGYAVRIDGLNAGTVRSVAVTRRDTAEIVLRLDPDAGVVGRGARLSVRSANLLGERFVDLDRGDVSRPVPSGTPIPIARTGSEVQLDDVLNVLTPDTRARLRILINEAGAGLDGRGRGLNELLVALPPTLRGAREVLAQVAGENRRLGTLVSAGSDVVSEVSGRRADAVRFLASLDDLLGTANTRRTGLQDTVTELPSTLRRVNSTLTTLEANARLLRPAATSLRRAAPALSTTLRTLPGFAAGTEQTLRTARSVAPDLTRLGRQGTGDVRRLRATVVRADDFARALQPVSASVGRGGVLRGVLDTMHGWQRTINSGDGLSRVFRLRATVTPSILQALVDRFAPIIGDLKIPLAPGAVAPAPDTDDGATQVRGTTGRTGPSSESFLRRVTDRFGEMIDHATRKAATDGD